MKSFVIKLQHFTYFNLNNNTFWKSNKNIFSLNDVISTKTKNKNVILVDKNNYMMKRIKTN